MYFSTSIFHLLYLEKQMSHLVWIVTSPGPLLITIAISESITIKATSKPFFEIVLFGQAVDIPQIKHKKHLAEKINYVPL